VAIRGSDAPPAESAHAEAAPPARSRALRWYDLVLLPAGAFSVAFIAATAALFIDWYLNAPEGLGLRFWARGTSATVWFAYTVELALYAGFILTGFLLLRLRGYRLSGVYFAPVRWRSLSAAGGLGAIFAGLFMWLLSLLPAETQQELMEKSELLSPSSSAEALTLFFIAVLLAPLAEELYFRGVMFRLLSSRISFVASAGLTAALFSLAHGHLFMLPGLGGWTLSVLLFVVGFVLAGLARLTGSLRASVIMHGVYNAVLLGPSVVALISGLPA